MRIILPLVAVALVGCAIDDDPDTETTDAALTNGTPVSHWQRPYAAFLTMQTPGGETFRCSGTLVAPDKVLTAAHCTRCAAAVDVTVMGDWGPADWSNPPWPGQAPSTSVPALSWSVHPGAYPTAPNCGGTKQQVGDELNAHTVFNHDLSVVRLSRPVAVPPLPVLLRPPFGFHPVQDLFGQPVTAFFRADGSIEFDYTGPIPENILRRHLRAIVG